MRKHFSLIFIIILFITCIPRYVYADSDKDMVLNAKAAVLIDADTNRILYGKNENEAMPMASTTKIMTLIIALQYGNEDDIVTFSKYAASQPDVQLNALAGEQYHLKDLLYAMMLKSYNDVAVAIAEYIGEKSGGTVPCNENISIRTVEESHNYVAAFANLMNNKAEELGCTNTYFITPNGLDAENDNGVHSTTAYELATIAAYAIKNKKITDITTTRSYSFSELNNKRTVSVNTTDRFLDMANGAVGLKTGFTGNAGYCFVGAIKQDGRNFVSVVLGSGWPPNKSFKWNDTKKLMSYGTSNYFNSQVFYHKGKFRNIEVKNGTQDCIDTMISSEVNMLLSDEDKINVIYELPDYVEAPIYDKSEVGKVKIYINDNLFTEIPIFTCTNVKKTNYSWFLQKILKYFTL